MYNTRVSGRYERAKEKRGDNGLSELPRYRLPREASKTGTLHLKASLSVAIHQTTGEWGREKRYTLNIAHLE